MGAREDEGMDGPVFKFWCKEGASLTQTYLYKNVINMFKRLKLGKSKI